MAPSTERELAKIAEEFQPKLLMFRLRRLRRINVTQSQKTQSNKFSTYPLARTLLAALEDEPEIVAAITPFLEAQEREILERQMRDPNRVIIESIWSPSHTSKEIQLSDLTNRVNAILRSRGETSDLDWWQLGWKLSHLGLPPRDRNAQGKRVLFSRDVRMQLHKLARNFELKLPEFANCADCEQV